MTNKALLQELHEDVKFIKEFLLGSVLENHIVISVDASIKKNPGGPSTIGVVIEVPGEPIMKYARFVKATTNNQAEMDAIFDGLRTIIELQTSPLYKIEIRSDSQVCVNGLNKPESLKDKELVRRRDKILELVDFVTVPVTFKWMRRNSTRSLAMANKLAQDLNGVENK